MSLWILTNSPHSDKVLKSTSPVQGVISIDRLNHYIISTRKLDIPTARRWRGRTKICEWVIIQSWVGDYYLLISPLRAASFWRCARSIVNRRLTRPRAKGVIKNLGKHYWRRVHTRAWLIGVWKYCESDFNVFPLEIMSMIIIFV